MHKEKDLSPVFLLEKHTKSVDWKNLSRTKIDALNQCIATTVEELDGGSGGHWDTFQMSRLEQVLDSVGDSWKKIPSVIQIAKLLYNYYESRITKAEIELKNNKDKVLINYIPIWTAKAANIKRKYEF